MYYSQTTMSKKTNKKTESPAEQPAYVKELLEKGVTVITGRSRRELDEKLAAIPSTVNFCTGHVDHYLGTNIFRVQVSVINTNDEQEE